MPAPTNRIATHPGAMLMQQIKEMGLTIRGVARDTGLREPQLDEIVREERDVEAETAIALGEYFGQSPEFWMNAQKNFELSKAMLENGDSIRARIRRRAGDHAVQ